MNNVILFESNDGSYRGVYNIETQDLYDNYGQVPDISTVLYGRCTYLRWNKNYKVMCIDGCSANCLDTVKLLSDRDIVIAYNVEDCYSIIIEFV